MKFKKGRKTYEKQKESTIYFFFEKQYSFSTRNGLQARKQAIPLNNNTGAISKLNRAHIELFPKYT